MKYFDSDGRQAKQVTGSAGGGAFPVRTPRSVPSNKNPNVKKSGSPPQLLRGIAWEKTIKKKYNLPNNTQRVHKGESIPDSIKWGRIYEIKDAKKVYLSSQFRGYVNAKMPIILICRKHTKVSGPLVKAIQKSGGYIIREK
ncbi:putative toxin [Metabacillus sp. 84]|uniref:putative toxin n=1 Tax=Metabacillus sp. 84 TaxID=3404705 RepID=UPI003CE6ACF4